MVTLGQWKRAEASLSDAILVHSNPVIRFPNLSRRHPITMQLFALGVNHTTATVDLREKLNFSNEELPIALRDLVRHTPSEEAVIVSTCNRTELYCSPCRDAGPMIDWLGRFHQIPNDSLLDSLYVHSQEFAVNHLLRVASGLDSMVLGEPQILGQLKTAYRAANQAGTVGTMLGRLFQHSFAAAKQVRTDTAIGSSAVSVAFAAVRLAQQIFGKFHARTALLIGAGETIELAARHLHENQLGRMVVANRTLERARGLATEFGGYAITLPEIDAHLAEADIVIASTGSPDPVLRAASVKAAIAQRKHRPMFIVDIAVPRDVEPEAGKLEDVYLYTVDDLNEVIQDNLRGRREAARQAEEIIETQTSHFVHWMRSRDSVDTIRQLRQMTENTKQITLSKAKKMIEAGKSPQEALDYLAHALTNNLLHAPCVELKHAAANGEEEFLASARRLYQLNVE